LEEERLKREEEERKRLEEEKRREEELKKIQEEKRYTEKELAEKEWIRMERERRRRIEEERRRREEERRKRVEEELRALREKAKQEKEKAIVEEIRRKARKEAERRKRTAAKTILAPEELGITPREVPRKPSLIQKILVRLVVAILIIAILGTALFIFWYFQKQRKTSPPSTPTPTPTPETIIPPTPPILEVNPKKTILEISSPYEIYTALDKFTTEQKIPEGKFVQFSIQNKQTQEEISLSEFLSAFKIEFPINFFAKFEDAFSFFVYSQHTGYRFGFAITLKDKEGVEDMMKAWESKAESNFEYFFVLMNKENPALNPNFRDAVYRGRHFRYITFSREDLGLCYWVSDEFLIFTSSYESMKKIIDLLISENE